MTFPDAKVNGHILGVPLSLENSTILRNLGIAAPSPIRTGYNWKGRFTPLPHQLVTAEYATLNKRLFILNDMGCVDPETEFLTPTGWKRIADWNGEPILQFNKNTETTSFTDAKYIKLPADKMYHLKTGRGVDQVLSPEHRVLYRHPTELGLHTIFCRDLVANHLKNTNGFRGKFLTTFKAPKTLGLNLSEAQLRLMVAVIADGYFPSLTGNRCQVRVKKERKKLRLRMLLQNCGCDFKEQQKDFNTATGYSVFTFSAPRREKIFTTDWWSATADQLRTVVDELPYWDGSKSTGARGFTFSSTAKQSIDFAQYACACAGFTSSIRNEGLRNFGTNDCYVLCVRTYAAEPTIMSMDSQGAKRDTIFETTSGDGFKYCFSVPDTYWVARRNGNIFVTGNTMKTISALWASDYLMEQGVIKKVLIVSPLSTLERVWGDEIFKNFPKRKFAVLYGSADKRKALLKSDADFYIVNHHGVEIIKDELKNRPDIGLYILDEGAIYRNSQTKMWKTMKKLITPDLWVWLMTGSPTPNSPTDAYGQMKLIKPENYLGPFTRFKDDVMQQFGMYKWVPRKGWEHTVNRILQPSVRYALEDCVNLPPTIYQDRQAELSPEQRQHFIKLSREAVTEINGSTVSAVNAGVLLSKLVQAACIAIDTMVLSSRGWVPIQDITMEDLVWDGVDWVTHNGVIYKGEQRVIECGGVTLTPDHEMLLTSGWKAAGEINGKSSEGPDWAKVWSPTCSEQSRVNYRRTDLRRMAMPVRLREGDNSQEPEPTSEAQNQPSTLRLQDRDLANPRHDKNSTVQHLVPDARPMPAGKEQGLGQLWRQGNNCVRTVATFVRELLGRYAGRVLPATDARQEGQQRTLQPRELPMANSKTAVEQQAIECNDRYPKGADDFNTGSRNLWTESGNPACPDISLQMECLQGVEHPIAKVYDIVNCGPRNRFVVQGKNGELRIVHNCGVLYDANGGTLRIDFGPRLKVLEETIEECNEKIIVFVPLTGTLNALAGELKKKYKTESVTAALSGNEYISTVDGSTPTGRRNKIFQDFQNPASAYPRIILSNPQCMAHGLTLTAATTIIWYAPIHSNEYYEQANARIARPGQTKTTNIVHIFATPVERKIYDTLRAKGAMQQIVLELAKEKS